MNKQNENNSVEASEVLLPVQSTSSGSSKEVHVPAKEQLETKNSKEEGSDIVEESSKGLCAVCSSPANKSCSACQLVSYCSSEHQKTDWSAHKKNCSPFMLRTNEQFGRHLVAARKLKAGTFIIDETPAFCAPRGLVDDVESSICLSCSCLIIENEGAHCRCSKCKWPICCWTCEGHKLHAQNECKILSENKISYPPTGDYPIYVIYKVIEILRGVLLKESDPDVWKQIFNLQYVTELGNQTDLFNDLPKLRKTFGVDNIGTDADWLRMLGVLNVNNFSMEGLRGGNVPSFTGFVFLQTSMFTHSCAPNCWWGVSVFPNYKIRVRTTVDIQKGEVLTIPYSYIYNAFGTHKRQELIRGDGEFTCKCNRCLDRTELGSYASAMICSECKVGNILPLNPIDDASEWKCIDCEHCYPCSSINHRMEELMTRLETCETLLDMENFVKENEGINLHPNHWLITEAEDVMCQQRARGLYERDEITLEERDMHIALCEHLLKVKNLIAPGFSLERARLLNHLARARLEKLEILVQDKFITDKEEISSEADLIYLLYDEALNFYKHDNTEISNNELYGLKCRTIMSDMNVVQERFIQNLTS